MRTSTTRKGVAVRIVTGVTAAVLATGAAVGAAAPASSAPGDPTGLTSTDNGDGTYTVPLLRSDVPDISVARVPAAENDEGRDVYYMVSTTMHLSPGAPIMKSYDLVSWEIVAYVYDRLGVDDASSLRNGKDGYGHGQWASSLRYRDGTFYVLFNTNNLGGAYLYRTDDVEHGTWQRTALGRWLHDPSLFFDEADGGTPYVFHGSGGTSAVRLSDDLTTIVAEYPDIFRAEDYAGEPFIGGLFEGAQVYHVDGYYYVAIITWPSGQNRQEVLLRSEHLLGRYSTADGSNPYEARSALNSDGFAQGGLVEVPDGEGGYEWWGMFFRDTYPLGRIPALIPATWRDGWPVFGDEGVVRLGDTFDKPIELSPAQTALARLTSIVASDDFANDAPHRPYSDTVWDVPAGVTREEVDHNGSDLDLAWQWNHNPDNRYWSLTARDGWLRLTNGHVVTGEAVYTKAPARERAYLEEARNVLGQRTFGPQGSAQTRLDVSGMRDGDVAGLAVYGRAFSYAAVRQVDGVRTLGVVSRTQPFTDVIDRDALETFVPGTTVPLGDTTDVHVKADTTFQDPNGQLWVQYLYSLDGTTWQTLGGRQGPLVMDWSLSHFMGYRFGLFSYATQQTGGVVDFDHFLLSGTLSSDDVPVTADALDDAITAAEAVDAAAYPQDVRDALGAALDVAHRARDAGVHTHNEADAPTLALRRALAQVAVHDESATPALDVTAVAGSRCLVGRAVPTVTLTSAADVPVSAVASTPLGSRTLTLEPGRSVFHQFTNRTATLAAGTVTVRLTGEVDGEVVRTTVRADYPAASCTTTG